MRPRVVALASLLFVCACDKTVPTAPGTTLVDIPAFAKLSVTSWTLGAPKAPPTKVKKTYRFHVGDFGPDVRFEISFEHGPYELVEVKPKGTPPPPVEAPSAVRIQVVENTKWAMTAKCEPDLKVPLALNPDGSAAYPKSVWAECTVVMKRKNGNFTVAPWIEVHGDGELVVKAVGSDESVVEE